MNKTATNTLQYKDADATLDFSVDWNTNWLGDDTISSSSWIVPNALTTSSDSISSGVTQVFIAGGVPGMRYTVTNRIVTAGGRTADQEFTLEILPEERELNLVQGVAYTAATSQPVSLNLSHPAFASAMTSDGTTVKLLIAERFSGGDPVSISGTVASVTGNTAKFNFDLTAAQTAALKAGDNTHRFDVVVDLAGSDTNRVKPVVNGAVNVEAQVEVS